MVFIDGVYHSFSMETYANEPLFGKRVRRSDGSLGEFVFKMYREVFETTVHLTNGLSRLGARPVSALHPTAVEIVRMTSTGCNDTCVFTTMRTPTIGSCNAILLTTDGPNWNLRIQ